MQTQRARASKMAALHIAKCKRRRLQRLHTTTRHLNVTIKRLNPMENNLDLSCVDNSDPDAEDLNFILQHFWGSCYWSDLLRKSKHINEKTKEYLLAKSSQFDLLQEKLIRLESECNIEPLTDEQIQNLFGDPKPSKKTIFITRAVERAHGIRKTPQSAD